MYTLFYVSIGREIRPMSGRKYIEIINVMTYIYFYKPSGHSKWPEATTTT